MEKKLVHICEVCGRSEIMTPDESFEDGWDYPPRMGTFGIISPRICGSCPIQKTVWWALTCDKKDINELPYKQKETIERIIREPASIIPQNDNV